MAKIKYILILFSMLFSSKEIAAQKDSITQQRTARKMLRQGNELYKKQQFTDASVSYQKALGSNSNYDKATYNLGNAFYQNKNFKEAIPQYELTTKTATDKFTIAEAYHNIGNAMMESKNYQGAVDGYKNALRNNPNDDETRYNLAVAQKLLEKEKKDNKDNKDDKKKDKNKDKKDKDGDKKDKNKDPKDDPNGDKKKDGKNDQNKDQKQDKEQDKSKPKPKEGRMSPQQVKQLLESLNNEEKKTQKKMNAKKAKGKKVKQEKDW
jgi:Ca-activated chloride channel family protein